jgi:chromosome partitioning protein
MSMMILFTNTKGGVGKSTLATHLAVHLFEQGSKVALLDADDQRSSSIWTAEAEPGVTVRVASTPEEVALAVKELKLSHDFVVADAPARLGDESRTLMLLADIAVFPMTPSILDLRSVAKATETLKYAHTINEGKPAGCLVLNRIKTRDIISRELRDAAHTLGLTVAATGVRDLQAFRDAAQQGTVVSRMRYRGREATQDITQLFSELLGNCEATTSLSTARAAND